MAKSGSKPPGDDDKKIADANWLMGDASKASPKPKPKPRPAPPIAKPPIDEDDHSYDLVAPEEEAFGADDPPTPPVPIAVVPESPRRPKPTQEPTDASDDDDESEVEQVW